MINKNIWHIFHAAIKMKSIVVVVLIMFVAAGCSADTNTFEGDIIALSVGNGVSFAIQSDGSLWSWGMTVGEWHTMQNHTAIMPVSPPKQVPLLENVVYISTSGDGNISQ